MEMTAERRKKLLWRWPVVVAGLVAIFLGLWYLAAGSIQAASLWFVSLPVIAILTSIIVLMFTGKKLDECCSLGVGLFWGLVFGLIFCPIPYHLFGVGGGILIMALAIGLLIVFCVSFVPILEVGLITVLGVSLGAGIIAGVFADFVTGLYATLIITSLSNMSILVKRFWRPFANALRPFANALEKW